MLSAHKANPTQPQSLRATLVGEHTIVADGFAACSATGEPQAVP